MNAVEERQLVEEARRRFLPPAVAAAAAVSAAVVARLLASLFDRQQAVVAAVRSGARRLKVFCTRRAGKTTLFALVLLVVAAECPGALCSYYAITRERAKELVWGELKRLNEVHGLGFEPNESELSLTRAWGPGLAPSVIRLRGADKLREVRKKPGDKHKLVVIDEAQSFAADVLHELVHEVIGPTLLDLAGSMVLGGTPGMVCDQEHLWYQLTRNDGRNEDERAGSEAQRIKGWLPFQWSWLDNPHMRERKSVLEDDIAQQGLSWDHPTIVRQYGDEQKVPRWANDYDSLFYAFSEGRNLYEQLPGGHVWQYSVGGDLGVDDAFALEVWAFAATCPETYEVDSFKDVGLTVSEMAKATRAFWKKYSPRGIWLDTGGLGKAIALEMQSRFQIPVRPAEKQEKYSFVQLMNGDLRNGLVRIRAGSPLAAEMKVLPRDREWQKRNPDKPPREHPSFPNHSCDAGLYGWRGSLHFLGRHPEDGPKDGTPAHAAKVADERERRLAARLRAQLEEEDDA